MGEVKSGWRQVKLGEVVERHVERVSNVESWERFIGVNDFDSGDLRLRRYGIIGRDSLPPTFRFAFRAGMILVPTRRPRLKKCVVAPFDGLTGEKILVLKPKDGAGLDPDFVPFLLSSPRVQNWNVEKEVGSVTPHFRWGDMAECEVSLPPFVEQKRLAGALKAIDNAIDATLDSIDKARLVWNAYAQTALCLNGRPTAELNTLLCYSSDGPFGSKLKSEHYTDSGARVIRLQNISTEGGFNDSDHAYIALEYFRSLHAYEVRAGDVIVAGLGDERIPMGRACLVPPELGPAINKADCFCLRPSEQLDARFLVHFLNSAVGLAQSRSLAQGTTRSRLNLSSIRKMRLPLLSQPDQAEVADHLDKLIAARRFMESRLHHLRSLRASMLTGME